ncbi:MAG: ergothioneine biosynthesis protein EgtB [Acidimicrobiales bacterium]
MADVMTTEEDASAQASSYASVRRFTELLAEPLSPEDQTVQSMPDVSPTKWHRAHTSWFFETFLLETCVAGYRPFHPAYGYLFNSYYEALGARHPRSTRGVVSRPGAAEIGVYRQYVDEHMSALLDGALTRSQAFLVDLGVQHEQQHQELLLMDIKHVLSCNPLLPAYRPDPSPASRALGLPRRDSWIEHRGGLVDVGYDGERFSFDNERPRHHVHVEPFALSEQLVTCAQWREFMADGGYQRPELWLSDGWAAVQQQGWEAPLYWSGSGDDWQVFTLHGPRPVDGNEPVVHVSYYEAEAFAHWAGARLPTESEWETLAVTSESCGQLLFPDPGSATLQPLATDSLMGSVWQWTSSAYSAYPGFRPAPGAVGEYNGKFMVGQMVLRGGCCVTPAGHIRPSYRNFFPPGARWAFSGLRLARD